MKNIHEFDRHVYGDNFLDMVKWLVYEHLFSYLSGDGCVIGANSVVTKDISHII